MGMVGVGGNGLARRRNSLCFLLKRNCFVDDAGELGVANSWGSASGAAAGLEANVGKNHNAPVIACGAVKNLAAVVAVPGAVKVDAGGGAAPTPPRCAMLW